MLRSASSLGGEIVIVEEAKVEMCFEQVDSNQQEGFGIQNGSTANKDISSLINQCIRLHQLYDSWGDTSNHPSPETPQWHVIGHAS